MKKKKNEDKATQKQSTEEKTNDQQASIDEMEHTDVVDQLTDENIDDVDVESIVEEKTVAETKFLELNDKYLRLLAEYDNFRRRSKQEKESLYAQSIQDVVASFLPVIDNLERALPLILDEENKKGIDMVLRQANEALTKFEVEEIEALGKTFDPNLHSAILHIEDDTYGEQEIVEVFEKGYKRGSNVLRHSIVKVAN